MSYTPFQTSKLQRGNDNSTLYLAEDVVGNSIVLMFTKASQWYLVEIQFSGEVYRKHVLCRYVRREIRSLTHVDRQKYFTALEIIHRLDLEDGRSKYGPQFVNYKMMTEKHLDKMTLDGCTIYHDGDVFFGAHAAFTLMLEQALQAIDPQIAAPYWDYSLDDTLYGLEWSSKSEIFSPDWFGSNNPNNTAHIIDEGRFANIPIPDRPDGPERNGFGRLTETWNQNPSNKVQRSSSICGLPTSSRLPGCTEVRGILASKSWSFIHIRSEYMFHAKIHLMVGGAWDCPVSFAELVQKYDDPIWAKIIGNIATGANTLWRTNEINGNLICDQKCSPSASRDKCTCVCPSLDEKAANGSLTHEDAYNFLDTYGIFNMIQAECYWCVTNSSDGVYRFTNLTQEQNIDLVIFVSLFTCHPGLVGQMGTPLAGPNDPLFWPTHGAYERLIDFLRLQGNTTHDCDEGEIDCRTHTVQWNYDDNPDCRPLPGKGMGWLDILPFEGFLGDTMAYDYSNQQLWQLFDPLNPRITYIYDNFEWDHCNAETENHK